MEQQSVSSDSGELNLRLIGVAAGTKTNFFGHANIQQNSFSLKGIDDALFMRNELIKVLERAAKENDPSERKRMLTIVIAGGGPTGVEVAGMLAELKHYILAKDYPKLEHTGAEIYVIDRAAHLLEAMSEKTHQEALQALHRLGVHVKLGTSVANFENDEVQLSNGDIIEAKTLIWAAGVTANTFDGLSNANHGKGHRIKTDEFNRVKGYENVYAVGDISIQHHDPVYPLGHPQLAQPAIQQGKTLAKNLIRMAKGKPMKPFKYFDKGEMAIIGRNLAVADLFKHKLHIGGILGLLSWLFIHVASLVNYNNKIKTLYGWIIAYLTRDQFLRMIFRSENRENRCQSNMEYNRNYQTNKIF